MKDMTTVWERVMKSTAHGHVFCLSRPFAMWFNVLCSWKTKVHVAAPLMRKRLGLEMREQPVFKVGRIALRFTRAVGIYTQTTAAMRAAHSSVMELAVHFWKVRGPRADMLQYTIYNTSCTVPTTHLW